MAKWDTEDLGTTAGAGATAGERLTLVDVGGTGDGVAFAADVAAGLGRSPKSLPFRYLYDPRGSRLFEQICETPEYYLTRAEYEILDSESPAIVSRVPGPFDLLELGSGSAVKTRLLIRAALERQPALRYRPIDISRSALETSALSLLRDFPQLRIEAVVGDYGFGRRVLAGRDRRPQLVLWLGSSIGNLDRAAAAAFLGALLGSATADDRLLLGIDVCRRSEVLERAYDDRAGVTAAFNRNILHRINRELGGRFDPDAFAHRAVWNEAEGRMEMYLVSTRRQTVRIDALALDVRFDAGEAIHTESSYKYGPGEIESLAAAAGLAITARWFDRQRQFATVLMARPVSNTGEGG
jgi:dimethylhistidine N-methyltransferase